MSSSAEWDEIAARKSGLTVAQLRSTRLKRHHIRKKAKRLDRTKTEREIAAEMRAAIEAATVKPTKLRPGAHRGWIPSYLL